MSEIVAENVDVVRHIMSFMLDKDIGVCKRVNRLWKDIGDQVGRSGKYAKRYVNIGDTFEIFKINCNLWLNLRSKAGYAVAYGNAMDWAEWVKYADISYREIGELIAWQHDRINKSPMHMITINAHNCYRPINLSCIPIKAVRIMGNDAPTIELNECVETLSITYKTGMKISNLNLKKVHFSADIIDCQELFNAMGKIDTLEVVWIEILRLKDTLITHYNLKLDISHKVRSLKIHNFATSMGWTMQTITANIDVVFESKDKLALLDLKDVHVNMTGHYGSYVELLRLDHAQVVSESMSIYKAKLKGKSTFKDHYGTEVESE